MPGMATEPVTVRRVTLLLAGGLLLGAFATSAVGLTLVVMNRSVPVALEWGARWTPGVWAAVFASVGAMIAIRSSGNAIGWLLMVAGVLSGSLILTSEVAIDIGLRTGASPAVMAWYTSWNWIPTVALVISALILFPTGRPRSRFWRGALWSIATFAFAYAVLVATAPEIHPYALARMPNPFASDLVVGVAWGDGLIYALFQGSLLLGPLALIARRRNADGEMRHQLRWVAFAAAMLVATVLVVEIPAGLGHLTGHYQVGTVAIAVLVTAIPVAMGIAVLRYRLYDIDRIIKRTVSYGLVTLGLAGIYASGVVGIGSIMRTLGGGGGDLVVAASTLAVAAAFVPLRRRVQVLVDRRFDRAGYDAQRTVEEFNQRLRDEIDLDSLSTELRKVAVTTMQPDGLGVWIHPERRP